MLHVVVGGFVASRWPSTFWLHFLAVVWAVAIVAGWVNCPLTSLERWVRHEGGMPRLGDAGFVAHYITGVFYPPSWKDGVLIAAFVIVAFSWVMLGRTATTMFRNR